ncbi:dihydroxyacetone kinase subunit DhaK [Alkalicoccus chagannorensis]|uniref:dihydroxyacetone kinase subunit DhaK n=1 Tax=Alkalicoccus chagannorensis TaxID=427072 RepID=UPI000421056F|nr:dihydroxyacetone kinase subunit DhaK [Alkalicoccus chagannorensis]
MKKLINNASEVVNEMLDGMVLSHPNELRRLDGTTVLVRKDAPVQGKPAIISGGGSGHEPAHAGFVGRGMLDAAVSGEVFTSPTPDQVFEAVKAVDGGSGVFLVIKNYTGDVMNFEMAAEMAEAEGIDVKYVVVNDDVAVEDSSFTSGRRGIAGTVLVHKILGAMAEEGASLGEIAEEAEKLVKDIKSMGMSLTPCIVPEAGKPGFTLADDEMEIGTGIHGEPGVERTGLLSADETAAALLEKIEQDMKLEPDMDVLLLINGLGATPLMEQYIISRAVHHLLKDKGVKVTETIVGEWMTSLEMAGVSVTLLKMNEDRQRWIAAAADTTAFKR